MKTNIAKDPSRSASWVKLVAYCYGGGIVLLVCANIASAVTIDVTSGTPGSLTGVPQSYNETRAVDVTVLSGPVLQVQSMTLTGFDGSGVATSATLGARIYETLTQTLIASANVTITSFGGPVTVPISANLISGVEYRIGFFASTTPPNHGEAILFQPTSFPYTESTGLLRINGAYSIASDSFPALTNIFDPQVSLQVVQVPEPGIMALLGIGLLGLLPFRQCFRSRQR